jgi:phosphoribosylglycinamide formyltransferase-1
VKKFAFYCSGKSSRVLKFYENNLFENFPAVFVFYDGMDKGTLNKLKKISHHIRIINFKPSEINPKSKEFSAQVSQKLLFLLKEHNIDYLFCFGDKLLKGELLIEYKNKIINFHPSILPAFPGLNAIDQALKSSVQLLGNTAHFIDQGIDTGPIIMQSVLLRSQFKSYEDVLKLQIDMLRKIWILLNKNKIIVDDFGKVKLLTKNKSINHFFSF